MLEVLLPAVKPACSSVMISSANYGNPAATHVIAIIDARSIANAYCNGVTYVRPGLIRMRRSTSPVIKR